MPISVFAALSFVIAGTLPAVAQVTTSPAAFDVASRAKPKKGDPGDDGALIYGEDHVTRRAMSMGGLADRLSGSVFKLERPVVDKTGIEGVYDFTLTWALDDAPLDERSSGSIFTALQEQLGLELEARKMTFRVLVVDSVDKAPSGD